MTVHLRAANIRPATFNAEARTIEAIVSTGAAVARPGFSEVLDLRGVNLARLVGAPVLDGHHRDTTRDQLSVIEAARMTPEGLLVVIRFRESTPAQAVMTDVANGTLRGLSIGYGQEIWPDRCERGQEEPVHAVQLCDKVGNGRDVQPGPIC